MARSRKLYSSLHLKQTTKKRRGRYALIHMKQSRPQVERAYEAFNKLWVERAADEHLAFSLSERRIPRSWKTPTEEQAGRVIAYIERSSPTELKRIPAKTLQKFLIMLSGYSKSSLAKEARNQYVFEVARNAKKLAMPKPPISASPTNRRSRNNNAKPDKKLVSLTAIRFSGGRVSARKKRTRITPSSATTVTGR